MTRANPSSDGRAAVLTEYGRPFVVQSFPRPDPAPGALVVDIDAATVCGSDVHVWLGHLAGRLPIAPPLTLGHEMAGTVTAVGTGADVDSLGRPVRVGDRVVWAHRSCGRCRQCTLDHEPTLCPHRYIGYLNDCSVPPHFTEERRLCQVYLQESRNLPEGDLRRLRWKQRHYIDLWQDVLRPIRPELSPPQRQVLVQSTISGMHSVLRFHSPLSEDELAAFMESVARHTLGLDTAEARTASALQIEAGETPVAS